ncbi:MAG: hypothetical protein K2Y37_15490 [Pirellulales bacterium]|nr:hypothetical protein [Pirellulales bacterium]
MDEKPKRRWFRFRLSTLLILTAIAAWAMATPRFVPGPAKLSELWPIPTGRPVEQRLNHQLAWPAFALAAFLAWKGASTVVERRRGSSE